MIKKYFDMWPTICAITLHGGICVSLHPSIGRLGLHFHFGRSWRPFLGPPANHGHLNFPTLLLFSFVNVIWPYYITCFL